MPMGKAFPIEVRTRALELRAQGKPLKEITIELNVSKFALCRWFNPEEAERHRERTKAWKRTSRVHTTINGKKGGYKVNGRRPKSKLCELCGKETLRMDWHHWDDNHLERGLWLCFPCHQFAGGVERGLQVGKYLEVKDKVLRGEL